MIFNKYNFIYKLYLTLCLTFSLLFISEMIFNTVFSDFVKFVDFMFNNWVVFML